MTHKSFRYDEIRMRLANLQFLVGDLQETRVRQDANQTEYDLNKALQDREMK